MAHPVPSRSLLAVLLGASLAFLASSSGCGGDGSSSPSGGDQELRPGSTIERLVPGDSATTDSIRLRIPLDSGSMCRIVLGGLKDVDGVVIYDPQGRPVHLLEIPPDTAGRPAMEFPVFIDGDHRLVIHAPGGTALEVTAKMRPGLSSRIVVPDSFEFDDSLTLARVLRPEDGWVQRTLHTSGVPDQDWMLVPLDSGFTYSFERIDSVRQYASSLEIFDARGVSRPKASSTGAPSWPAFGRDTVLVRVLATDGEGVRYRVRTTRSPGLPAGGWSPDRWETDDTSASANAIRDDSMVQERTLHGWQATRDVDWISLAVDSGRTYAIHLRGTLAGTSATMRAPDSTERSLATSTRPDSVGATSIDSFPCVRRGRLLIRVSASTPRRYAIAATSRAGVDPRHIPDIGEPDSDSLHAYALLDTLPLRRFLDGNDTDWIRIPLEANTIYEVVVKNLDTVYTSILNCTRYSQGERGWDSTKTLRSYDSWSHKSFVRKAGARWIRLTREDTTKARRRYEVRVRRFTLPVDSLEDDTRASAVVMRADAGPIVRWVDSGDVDWFRLEVDSAHPMYIRHEKLLPSDLFVNSNDHLRFEFLYTGPSLDKPLSDSLQLSLQADDRTRQDIIDQSWQSRPIYVKVTKWGPFPSLYVLDLTSPPPDTLESPTPTRMTTDGTPFYGLVSNADRYGDHFEFPVQAGQFYRWSVQGAKPLDVRFWTPGGGSSDPQWNADSGVFRTFRAIKDSVVGITIWNGPEHTLQPDLAVVRAWQLPPEPGEPDNTVGQAGTLPTDGTRIRRTAPRMDVDHMRFRCDSNTVYRIRIQPRFRAELLVRDPTWMLSKDSSQRGDRSDSARVYEQLVNTANDNILLTSTYPPRFDSLLVRIKPYDTSIDPVDPSYWISVEKFPGDSLEPRDASFDIVPALPAGTSAIARTLPPGDVDRVRVQIPQASRFVAAVQSDWPLEVKAYTSPPASSSYMGWKEIAADSIQATGQTSSYRYTSGAESNAVMLDIKASAGGPDVVHYSISWQPEP